MNTELEQRFEFVKHLATDAGQYARGYQDRLRRGDLTIASKGVQDFVSEADRETERFIRQALSERYPDDGFLGEESGTAPATDGHGTWVVDPIDGTTNFLRGQSLWCVSIAYLVDEEPVLGAIYVPQQEELFCALAGAGAWLNDTELNVEQGEMNPVPLVAIGYSRNYALSEYLALIEDLHSRGIEHRRYGTAAVELAHVACGRFDGYKEAFINAWDIMAGVVILREAGAWVELTPLERGYAMATGVPALRPILSSAE